MVGVMEFEFPQGLKSLCENLDRPRGTQIFFPPYPALRPPTPTRAKAARLGDPGSAACCLSCPRPCGAGFLAVCTTVATQTLVLTQTLKSWAKLFHACGAGSRRTV